MAPRPHPQQVPTPLALPGPIAERDIIISVADHSGTWSRPYTQLGYRVIRIDPKHGPNVDQLGRGITEEPVFTGPGSLIMEDDGEGWPMTVGMAAAILRHDPLILGGPVRGCLFAPPCTDFTVSGARWWAGKDERGETAKSVRIVEECLSLRKAVSETLRWWALENPVGRLKKLVPQLGDPLLIFQPNDYAGLADDPQKEAYTKRTCLWGDFNPDLPKDWRAAVMIEKTNKHGVTKRGSWMWANLGGKSERTKELRSVTPQGFSRAFAIANP
jgi:hypothetical protein